MAASRRWALPPAGRALLVGGIAVVALTPVGSLPPAGYLRGVTGDLSITTLVLLTRSIVRGLRSREAVVERETIALQTLVAVAGLFLYPLALGIGRFDPYRLGYASPWMLLALAVVALATWLRGLRLPTLCIALAVLAWSLGWYESNNLWDYLLDPLVAIYALSALVIKAACRMSARRARSSEEGPR